MISLTGLQPHAMIHIRSLSVDELLENELTTADTTDLRNRQHLVSGYYNGSWGKWQLDVNADVLWNNQDKDQQVKEIATDADNRIFSTDNQVDSRLYAAKAVVSRPLWNGKLSFGTEWSFIRRTDLYTSQESFINDSDTKLNEDNGAGFVELSQRFGKITAMVGLRYEHMDSRYYEGGKKMEEQSRTYDNLFPSVMVSFPVRDVRMRVNYTRKITRPAFSQLNGNVQYINLSSAFIQGLCVLAYQLPLADCNAGLRTCIGLYHVCIYPVR